ncbi:hypothetical protein ACA910_014444 [Epithemia clementina (nom. ined.)]
MRTGRQSSINHQASHRNTVRSNSSTFMYALILLLFAVQNARVEPFCFPFQPATTSILSHNRRYYLLPLSQYVIPKYRNLRSALNQAVSDDDDDDNNKKNNASQSATATKNQLPTTELEPDHSNIIQLRSKPILFSIAMTLSGAILGPFLDSYHSAFGVLQYDQPIQAILWGSEEYPALTTAWWVPPLFGVAGFLIGWLYILLDQVLETSNDQKRPTAPKIFIGISFFTLQYWLSGVLFSSGLVDRSSILNIMSLWAAAGFAFLDRTTAGLITSAATAIGGPLIEVVLISKLNVIFGGTGGYHYTDLGETGFFPLWISPIYFLGGPAVGNLARGIWSALTMILEPASSSNAKTKQEKSTGVPCHVCQDTRRVPCPNCDGKGEYLAMVDRYMSCTSCRGKGFVICRTCFQHYNEDPMDIEAIREKMSRMPD